uniref:Uncharacterized protein n=1 Tax=Peronospora matthiolae TaxID=2874970 RepID=A0AAV1U9D6_9STRA
MILHLDLTDSGESNSLLVPSTMDWIGEAFSGMSYGLKVHLCTLAMYHLVIFFVKSGLAAYIDVTKQLSNIKVFVAIQLTQTCAS